jgi:uncharacterized protein DUF1579
MKSMFSTVLVVALFTSVAVAQQPSQPPKPGPEQKRIGYFAGDWSFQGEAKESPMGRAGKITTTESCKWFTGGFHLVCTTKGTGPTGSSTSQSTMAYDPGRKAYTYHSINSMGSVIFVRGQVDGKVWTWSDEVTMEGKTMKIRATVTEESPTAYSFKLEAGDGASMAVVEEGRATKVKKSTTP